MAEDFKYEITIRKRVPVISRLITEVLCCCLFVLVLSWFFFAPSLSPNNEMQVVTTINIIPNGVKWLIIYSAIGAIIFYILYRTVAIHKSAILSFSSDSILISTEKKINIIPFTTIQKIDLIDVMRDPEMPKGEFIVLIYHSFSKHLRFELKDYYDSDQFIDTLLTHEDLKGRLVSHEQLPSDA